LKTGDSRYDLNTVVSDVLKYGVVISAVLLLVGLALLLIQQPAGMPGSVQQLISSNFDKPTLDVGQLLTGVAQGSAGYVIQLGVVVLLLTPVVRVLASVIVFAADRDRTYVVITLIVLGILLFSILVVGPAEAGSAKIG
jgi:uncharacterized membrane protein